jgi:THO complex subunit 2
MSDIAFSPEAYDKAISKIEALDRDVASWRAPLTSEQRAERTRLKARIDQLKEEKEAQSTTVATTSRRLQRESKHWFGSCKLPPTAPGLELTSPSVVVEKNMQRKLSYQLHQYCFIPRCLQTPADAIFVAKFIRLAHDLGTVGFSTVFVYQNFFSDNLAGTIFSCTTNEARNFGRCLSAMMQNLDAWHSSEALYKKEALGLKDGDDSGKKLPGMIFKSRRESPMSAMSWTQFRDFYGKAHNALTKVSRHSILLVYC